MLFDCIVPTKLLKQSIIARKIQSSPIVFLGPAVKYFLMYVLEYPVVITTQPSIISQTYFQAMVLSP